jgi:hypothetical protein
VVQGFGTFFYFSFAVNVALVFFLWLVKLSWSLYEEKVPSLDANCLQKVLVWWVLVKEIELDRFEGVMVFFCIRLYPLL